MSDDPTPPIPIEEPDPAAPVGDPLDPVAADVAPLDGTAVRSVARDVALGAIAFIAVLLLLLGATRLMERGTATPGSSPPSGAVASPSASAAASPSPSAAPSSSASPGPSGSPGASASPGSSAATPSGSVGDPVLVGAGDIADCGTDGDEATAALLDGIAGTVFTAGDNAYERGTLDEFQRVLRADVGAASGPDQARARQPRLGNVRSRWLSRLLRGRGRGSGGTSWYSYDLGAWHIIVLDSMCDKVGGCGPDSVQGRWLATDLAANHPVCTMAIFHHPRFSSGEHGNEASMDAFWRPLYAADVDVIVNGHDHDYERFAPQDPDGKADEARGIREFVVGTGGAALRNFPREAPNSEVRLAGGYGVIKFTLHESSYDAEFIAAGNDFRDVGANDCH